MIALRTPGLACRVMVALAIWSVTSALRAEPVLQNPSFELGPVNPFPGYGPINNWSGGGSSGTNTVGGPFLNGLAIPDGNWVAFQQGTGSLTQNVTGFIPGKTYTLQYMFDERGLSGAIAAPYAQVNGVTVVPAANFQRHDAFVRALSVPFTATSSTQQVLLGNISAAGDNTALFDAVRITRAVPLINNGDFEQVILNPATFQYAPSGTGWTFAGGSGISRNGSGFQNGGIAAPEGNQIGFLQGASSMSQVISGFEVGKQYSLSFDFAGRVGGLDNNLTVLLNGSPIFNVNDVTSSNWTAVTTGPFTATSSSYTLTIAASNPFGGDRTTFVDDLRFNYVPEPSSAMLAILGLLGLVGYARVRRHRS
jgi:hypothetical protein